MLPVDMAEVPLAMRAKKLRIERLSVSAYILGTRDRAGGVAVERAGLVMAATALSFRSPCNRSATVFHCEGMVRQRTRRRMLQCSNGPSDTILHHDAIYRCYGCRGPHKRSRAIGISRLVP